MLSQSLNKAGGLWKISRSLSSAAANVAKSDAGMQDSSQGRGVVNYQPELNISRLSNSLRVSSLETPATNSQFSIVFRAGTRHENESNLGVAHRICAQVGLGSNKNGTYGTVTNFAKMGVRLRYNLSRELIVFEMEMPREMSGDAIMLLGDIICRPSFPTWELDYSEPSMMQQIAEAKANHQSRASDLVHKAAFRDQGLGNALRSKSHMVGKHNSDMLFDFHAEHFLSGEGGIIAENIDHNGLLTFCSDFLPVIDGKGGVPKKTKFLGGERRKDVGGSSTTVIVAGEGPSMANSKELAAFAVLSQYLGTGPVSPWSDQMGLGLIGKSTVGKACSAQTVSFTHSDTGLFGVSCTGEPEEMSESLRAAVAPLKAAAGNVISDADIALAKIAAQSRVLQDAEGERIYDELVMQTLLGDGEFLSPPERVELIKSVTGADVSAAAKKVTSNLAMGAVGNLSHTPYLDEIVKS